MSEVQYKYKRFLNVTKREDGGLKLECAYKDTPSCEMQKGGNCLDCRVHKSMLLQLHMFEEAYLESEEELSDKNT